MKKYIPAMAIVFALAVLSLGTVVYGGETSKLSVEGMTCQGCVNKVESAVKDIDGVESVNVDLESNSAEVTYASAELMPTIQQAIADAGFTVKTGEATEKAGKSMDKKAGKTCGDKRDGCADKDKSAKEKGKDI
ncbi:MAG: Copper chaperone CopZ [Candidatus Marinimicrobia bacterium]|nr:Copper chaperone CopZ [Candidatus Neomarinimicrobiota bacterium]